LKNEIENGKKRKKSGCDWEALNPDFLMEKM